MFILNLRSKQVLSHCKTACRPQLTYSLAGILSVKPMLFITFMDNTSSLKQFPFHNKNRNVYNIKHVLLHVNSINNRVIIIFIRDHLLPFIFWSPRYCCLLTHTLDAIQYGTIQESEQKFIVVLIECSKQRCFFCKLRPATMWKNKTPLLFSKG